MRKSELVDNIALRTGLSKSEAASALETITETIATALEQGEDVQLAGFGRFSVARRAARVGQNREIRESTAIVAEITPANPNVYYEVGYAHAAGTPTILLVRRGQELPFDIRSFRCILYDDSIGGKPQVEAQLRKHLAAITASRPMLLTSEVT